MKDWLEEHYKLGGLTPFEDFDKIDLRLEEHYKLGGLTPQYLYRNYPTLLEEH